MPDLSGVFVTGSSPFWILADTTTSVKTLPHGAPVRHLCDLAPGGPASRASFLVADAEVSTASARPVVKRNLLAEASKTI
jgi:hypothetical protein